MNNRRENKRRRRLERKKRNIEKEVKHKKEAWDSGKLIEENHNDEYYTEEYTIKLGDRLFDIIFDCVKSSSSNEEFIVKFRDFKRKIIDFILLYCPTIQKGDKYYFLKACLECYWDNPDQLLSILVADFKRIGYIW
jgi:hypothetical protein